MDEVKCEISVDALHEHFTLDSSGLLYWKKKPKRNNCVRVGAMAGATTYEGYRVVRLMGVQLRVHRVVWAMTHGEWPTFVIDHINGDRSDNRPENLRDVDYCTNSANRKLSKNNKSGVNGVFARKHGFEVAIKRNGTRVWLGTYRTLEHAKTAIIERGI